MVYKYNEMASKNTHILFGNKYIQKWEKTIYDVDNKTERSFKIRCLLKLLNECLSPYKF